jgi:hypothetical protein
MGDLLAALFNISWGSVGLVELLWTLGALVAMCVTFMAIWRSQRRSGSLHGIDDYTRRWANRSILVRNGFLGVVLEVTVFVGIWALLDPPGDEVTVGAAVSGFVLWLLEIAVIITVLYEEFANQRIRGHLARSWRR